MSVRSKCGLVLFTKLCPEFLPTGFPTSDKGVLKSTTITADSSISPCSSISFCCVMLCGKTHAH